VVGVLVVLGLWMMKTPATRYLAQAAMTERLVSVAIEHGSHCFIRGSRCCRSGVEQMLVVSRHGQIYISVWVWGHCSTSESGTGTSTGTSTACGAVYQFIHSFPLFVKSFQQLWRRALE